MVQRAEIAHPTGTLTVRRLLRVGDVTGEQALFLAHGIVTALGRAPVAGPAASVLVDHHGEVLTTGPPGPLDRSGLAALLTLLADNVRSDERARRTLRDAARDIAAGAAAPEVASRLAGPDPERVAAEVAVLVNAALGRRPEPAATPPARAPLVPVPRRPRAGLRPLWRGLAALAALAAAVLLEWLLLHDRLSNDLRVLLDAGRAAPEASAPTTVPPRPVAAPAPPSSTPVGGLDLRPLVLCAPGQSCQVRLQVDLTPPHDALTLAWDVMIVDRCTGAQTTAPGGKLAAAAQDTRLNVVTEVPLPAARTVAVFAVTGSPGRASSPPLIVGSPSC
ncbi:hypothetical protein [Amycolatopsis thermophila]|uniref:Uncharacterized protein n=1 Tax=Amycolatopsis thermophila TaxID=206084 RepID=A0ABU0EYT5_9PSEU|nr:hypothetical protein [Amycolatopsis thermophila]MDQ0380479.1 hypothetical protein [Amycolatopsis thermophila]